jgi:cysteine desulfurase
MEPYFSRIYGNASSIHALGFQAKEALQSARESISKLMNASSEELIFTGGATEANNLVLKGFAFKNGMQKTHIAISLIEHDCVLNSAKWLDEFGYKVSYLPVDSYGLLNLEELENALQNGVNLVSIIHANNEIGTIQPLKEIGALCHEYDALLHTDAAQSFGKIPIDVNEMNIDFMTVNAHKIYGPKGVGALYKKQDAELDPLIHGGGHEYGLRSGTENIPGIMGFSKAVNLRKTEMTKEAQTLTHLRDSMTKRILELEETYLNGHPSKRLPNISNLRFSYIEGESLILLLNDEGIYLSSGSACSSMSTEPSHVLLALGLKPEEIHGSIRISLGNQNTKKDVDYFLEVLPEKVERLRHMSPLYKNSIYP